MAFNGIIFASQWLVQLRSYSCLYPRPVSLISSCLVSNHTTSPLFLYYVGEKIVKPRLSKVAGQHFVAYYEILIKYLAFVKTKARKFQVLWLCFPVKSFDFVNLISPDQYLLTMNMTLNSILYSFVLSCRITSSVMDCRSTCVCSLYMLSSLSCIWTHFYKYIYRITNITTTVDFIYISGTQQPNNTYKV